ncbi:hypothetical protein K443DRAFT_653465, partial [Laccaria amethystina LaAM-08-1]
VQIEVVVLDDWSIREEHERRGPSANPHGYGHGHHSSLQSDVVIIGYGHGNGGEVLRLRLVMRGAMIVRYVALAMG